jgi:hypothetical protein
MNWPTACITLSVWVASSLVGDSISACTLQVILKTSGAYSRKARDFLCRICCS